MENKNDGCRACGREHGEEQEGGRWALAEILLSAALFLAALFLAPEAGPWRLACFAVPYLLAGWRVLREAAENILRGEVFDENFLMTVASVGALCIGEYPEAVAVMVLYRVGEYCEDLAVEKSRRSIAGLMDICPETAAVERDGQTVTVGPGEVAVGEIILVKPGERVPLDGVVVSGAAALDTAALTGESAPRDVGEGESVRNGCIDLDGVLRIRVTRVFGESTVSRILALVEDTGANKSRSENFITRFAKIYTPAVVGAAAVLAVLPPLLLGGGWSEWIRRALTFLVISCPCALVISVPLTFFGGIGAASRQGILIKGSRYVEALSRAEAVAFDKTGTLTRGTFVVRDLHPDRISRKELLDMAAAAERYSDHPISRSLKEAGGELTEDWTVTDVRELPGQGVRALVNGRETLVGNARLMESAGIPWHGCDTCHPGTMLHVAVDGEYEGHIVVTDEVKESARGLAAALKRLGVKKCVMLTGDKAEVGEALARELGLDECRAALSPEDKVAAVRELRAGLSPAGRLLYVGDGINDAPVLAGADVGVAMGAIGSDAAVEAADVVIMDDDPGSVARSIGLARRTMAIARQNIAFALAVKAVVLVLGALGLAAMWVAVFADVGVCLLCILNALRALRGGKKTLAL